MKLRMKIENLSYGDLLIRLIPLVRDRITGYSAGSRCLRAAANLPENLIYELAGAVPDTEKNGILAELVREHKETILAHINRSLDRHRLGFRLSQISLDTNLNLLALVDSIDPVVLVERLLPKLKQAGGLTGSVLATVPKPLWAGFLSRIPDLEQLLAGILNQAEPTILGLLNDSLSKQNIRGRITGFRAEE